MPNSGTYGVSWGKGGQLERAQRGQLGRGHSYHALFNPRSGRTFCHSVEVIEKYWNRKLETQLGKGVGWKASIRTLLCVQYSPRRYPIISPFLPKRASPARMHPYRGAGVYFIPSTRHPYSYVRWNAGVTGEGDIRGSKVIGQERPWGWEDNQPLCSYPTGDMAKGPSLATSLSVSKERG